MVWADGIVDETQWKGEETLDERLTPDMLRALARNTAHIWGEGSVLMIYADAWESECTSLQQRVEALERVRFWAQSYMTSAGADMSSQRTARAGLVQALAAAQVDAERPDNSRLAEDR